MPVPPSTGCTSSIKISLDSGVVALSDEPFMLYEEDGQCRTSDPDKDSDVGDIDLEFVLVLLDLEKCDLEPDLKLEDTCFDLTGRETLQMLRGMRCRKQYICGVVIILRRLN